MMILPHDHPTPDRAHRIYAALTNHCNRSCPWCSTYSSPERDSWITWEQLESALPPEGVFEMQLEGGEPTLHPQFWHFVERFRADPYCIKLVLCTNGTTAPRDNVKLRTWLERLGQPLLIKLSLNHHLLERDPGLLRLAGAMQSILADLNNVLGGKRELVCNVRLRKGYEDDDSAVAEAVKKAGLSPISNVFFLQRYGYASAEADWDEPFLAGYNFRMVNPDGAVFSTDLVARSEAMGKLK